MATGFLNYTKHGVFESSDIKATLAGHIVNLKAIEDTDNGSFASRGAFVAGDVWKAAKPVVAKPVFLIGTSPLIYEDFTKSMQDEANFYNASGDVMRAYELEANDKFNLSAEAFASGASPAVGQYLTISAISWKVGCAASSPEGQTFVAQIYGVAANGNFMILVEKNA